MPNALTLREFGGQCHIAPDPLGQLAAHVCLSSVIPLLPALRAWPCFPAACTQSAQPC